MNQLKSLLIILFVACNVAFAQSDFENGGEYSGEGAVDLPVEETTPSEYESDRASETGEGEYGEEYETYENQ